MSFPRSKRWFVLISVLLVLVMVIGACGGGSQEEPAEEPAAEEVAPAEEEEAAEEPAEEEAAPAEEEAAEEPAEEEMADIVDTAVAAGDFTTLVAAVDAAGLVETLKGDGPFTVFAPTDDAFAALPEGTVESLLEDPEGALTDILLYHVVSGKVMAADVVGLDGQPVETVGGESFTVSIDGENVMVDGANVVVTDIEASNGVIHVIDAVIIPGAEEEAAEEGDDITVALVYGVAGDGFYITMEKGLRDAAEAAGINAVADGPSQFDAVQQTPILDAMVAKGVDAICIAATDKQAMIEPMQRAHDAGIPIISVDTFIGDGDYENGPVTFPLSYVGSDNVQGGQIACDAVIEAIGGEGKIYIQNTKPGISTTDQRQQGCEEAIEATGGAVELIGVDFNDDSAAKAAEQTAAVLQREPDLAGIFGTNLFSAQGAAQAVKNAGLDGIVKIANFDAPEAAIVDLENEVVDIVIAQLPYEMGQKCVEYSLLALEGMEDEIPARWPTGYVIITRDNVDSEEAQTAIYKSE